MIFAYTNHRKKKTHDFKTKRQWFWCCIFVHRNNGASASTIATPQRKCPFEKPWIFKINNSRSKKRRTTRNVTFYYNLFLFRLINYPSYLAFTLQIVYILPLSNHLSIFSLFLFSSFLFFFLPFVSPFSLRFFFLLFGPFRCFLSVFLPRARAIPYSLSLSRFIFFSFSSRNTYLFSYFVRFLYLSFFVRYNSRVHLHFLKL